MLARQIRLLQKSGIKDITIVGKSSWYVSKLIKRNERHKNNENTLRFFRLSIPYTEWLPSILNQKAFFEDYEDMLFLLNGLVFDEQLIIDILSSPYATTIPVQMKADKTSIFYPKARVDMNNIIEVRPGLYDVGRFALLPIIKIDKDSINVLRSETRKAWDRGASGWDALNTALPFITIKAMKKEYPCVRYVDTLGSLAEIGSTYRTRYLDIQTFSGRGETTLLKKILNEEDILEGSLLVVCKKKQYEESALAQLLTMWGYKVIVFSTTGYYPDYQKALRGASAYKRNGCSAILSFGNRCHIDMAKLIRAILSAKQTEALTSANFHYASTKHIAIPLLSAPGSWMDETIFYDDNSRDPPQFVGISSFSFVPSHIFMDITLSEKKDNHYYLKCAYLEAVAVCMYIIWSIDPQRYIKSSQIKPPLSASSSIVKKACEVLLTLLKFVPQLWIVSTERNVLLNAYHQVGKLKNQLLALEESPCDFYPKTGALPAGHLLALKLLEDWPAFFDFTIRNKRLSLDIKKCFRVKTDRMAKAKFLRLLWNFSQQYKKKERTHLNNLFN